MSRYAFNLKPCGSSQKSFYGKSIVIVTNDRHENTQRLYSYDTQVACFDMSDNTFRIFGWYSMTTSKHIHSFLMNVFGEDDVTLWEVIRYAMKEWKCKSFKAFCDASPKISTDETYIIKAMCKPTVSLTNIQ